MSQENLAKIVKQLYRNAVFQDGGEIADALNIIANKSEASERYYLNEAAETIRSLIAQALFTTKQFDKALNTDVIGEDKTHYIDEQAYTEALILTHKIDNDDYVPSFGALGNTDRREIKKTIALELLRIMLDGETPLNKARFAKKFYNDLNMSLAFTSIDSHPVFGQSVKDLYLTKRAENCLLAVNIKTVGELVQKSERELFKIPNMGKTTINDIKKELERYGLDLGMEIDTFIEL